MDSVDDVILAQPLQGALVVVIFLFAAGEVQLVLVNLLVGDAMGVGDRIAESGVIFRRGKLFPIR